MDPVLISFYQSCYHGNIIPFAQWQAAETEARGIINRYKRIYTVSSPDEMAERMAVCAVAEIVYKHALEDQTAGMSSVSIGSTHVSYVQPSANLESKRAREIYKAASLYLDIYRG